MCLIGLAWRVHPRHQLVVAANRDEFYERPTAPAQWWQDHPDVFAGRDLRAGGTWMAVTRSGRFAALTNVRRPDDDPEAQPERPSRGGLVHQFVTASMSSRDYVSALHSSAGQYAGFNLLVCDGDELWWGNDTGAAEALLPGVHTVSNASLDTLWPKSRRLSARLASALGVAESDAGLVADCFDALDDRIVAADDDLPVSDLSIERRRAVSAGMIVTDDYGTRASTVALLGESVWMEERTIVAGVATSSAEL